MISEARIGELACEVFALKAGVEPTEEQVFFLIRTRRAIRKAIAEAIQQPPEARTREAVLEEAALMCEQIAKAWPDYHGPAAQPIGCAEAIRSLKRSEPQRVPEGGKP